MFAICAVSKKLSIFDTVNYSLSVFFLNLANFFAAQNQTKTSQKLGLGGPYRVQSVYFTALYNCFFFLSGKEVFSMAAIRSLFTDSQHFFVSVWQCFQGTLEDSGRTHCGHFECQYTHQHTGTFCNSFLFIYEFVFFFLDQLFNWLFL